MGAFETKQFTVCRISCSSPNHRDARNIIYRFLEMEASDVADITYQIVMHIGVLSQSNTGWTKELNLVSWNDRPPKYDIRDWSPDRNQLGRGVTLTREELLELRDLLNRWEL